MLSARLHAGELGPALARLGRRRWVVRWTKRLLPLLALALLALIALWPEIDKMQEQGRVTFRRLTAVSAGGAMVTDARYRSVDERGQPYTVTAATATQVSPERINLTMPKADITLASGNWLMLEADKGVYMQHLGQLDLEGHVTLYRDDGTTVHSATATIDLKSGAAAGNDSVHAEGPFGTLDAQNFALLDKGRMIQFGGPGHLVVNGSGS
jgi:lipopolysaccharide export system protein LptC